MLHRALRPGGVLLTNFDTRPASPENAWHLYSDDLPLRRTLQDIGFVQLENLSSRLFVFRRVRPTGMAHLVRRARTRSCSGRSGAPTATAAGRSAACSRANLAAFYRPWLSCLIHSPCVAHDSRRKAR